MRAIEILLSENLAAETSQFIVSRETQQIADKDMLVWK
jgi:hypothetical protein